MKKNNSQPNLIMNGLSLRKSNQINPSKKVQGFDKTAASESFAGRIEKIKKRPQQFTLQDQYVKGLQDQIQYLEMELKLLREKQIAKHSQVDQLETFFGDGIPINENILAIKNGFNNYKNECDKKIISLQKQKQERTGLIEGLKSRATRMTEQIQNLQKNYKNDLLGVATSTHQRIKEDCHLKEEIEQKQQMLRNFKAENRRYSELINTFERNKEIQSVAILKNEGNKLNKLNKIRQSIANKEKEQQILEAKYEDLKKQQEEKSYVIKLQENNLKMKKKAISLQKQLNSLQIKIEEKKVELEQKLKERQKQISNRTEMVDRLNAIKESIDRQNGLSIEDLERIASENQISYLQKLIEKNRKISKYVTFYGDLLSKIEDEIQIMGQQKPDLKRQVQAYQIEGKNLEKDIQKAKQKKIQLCQQIAESKSKIQFVNKIVPVSIQKIKKNNEKIKFLQSERQKMYEEIKMRQKQLQLVQILKGLSLEDVQISSSSNSTIQDRILDFMRSWESLSRA